jgi:8-oxo-dGTP pyrophosphatase MutT (NUDIX family)
MSHIHDKIDFVVDVYVVYQNTVLLRKHDKYGIWLGVGGHIELDEDPNEAAIRETREEVGLEIQLYCESGKKPDFNLNKKSLIPPGYLNRHPINDQHEHLAFVYFATTANNELKLSETEVAEDCRWFTKEELLQNDYGIRKDFQLYALQALEILGEKK